MFFRVDWKLIAFDDLSTIDLNYREDAHAFIEVTLKSGKTILARWGTPQAKQVIEALYYYPETHAQVDRLKSYARLLETKLRSLNPPHGLEAVADVADISYQFTLCYQDHGIYSVSWSHEGYRDTLKSLSCVQFDELLEVAAYNGMPLAVLVPRDAWQPAS